MSAAFSTRPAGQAIAPCPLAQQNDSRLHWIEIELVDEDGRPVAGEPYRLVLPGGGVVNGTLDGTGWARIDGIKQAGDCQVTFPQRDQEAWFFVTPLAARANAA